MVIDIDDEREADNIDDNDDDDDEDVMFFLCACSGLPQHTAHDWLSLPAEAESM